VEISFDKVKLYRGYFKKYVSERESGR